MDRKTLEANAKKLGIEFTDETTDEELKTLVEAKEKDDKKVPDDDPLEFYKSEAQKAFEARDEAKKDVRSLKAKMAELEKATQNAIKPEEYKELKEQLDSLRTFKAEVDKAKEEEELKQKTEIERAEIAFNKKMEETERKWQEQIKAKEDELKAVSDTITQKEQAIQRLRRSSLENQIFEAASKHKAYNPTQIVGLLKSEFEYDDNLDRFSKYIKDDKGKLADMKTVEETVKEFLSDPINDNLVKSPLKVDNLNINESDKKMNNNNNNLQNNAKEYDPKNSDIVRAAEENGFTDVEKYIDVLKVRDAKLAKVAENRK